MGVSTTSNRISYTGAGSSYSFPYYFAAQSDLKVYLYNSSSPTATLQALNTDYTIGGTPNSNGIYSSGGTVITSSSIPAALQLIIYRDPSPVQNFAVLQNGLIPSTALVQEFDFVTLLEQRLADQTSRSVSLKDGTNQVFDPTLPLGLTASSALLINGQGTGFIMGPTADQISNAQTAATAAAASATAAASSAATALAVPSLTGPSGYIYTANGSSVVASFQAYNLNVGSGILPVVNGGLGRQGFQPYGVVYGNGSSAPLVAKSTITDGGFLWQSATTNPPAFYSPDFYTNLFINSAFDWWQVAAGSSVVIANSSAIYVPDQWYVTNTLGTNGVITCNRASSAVTGSLFACQVQISTAPTASQTNGTELWQVIENPSMLARVYNQNSITVGARIRGLGQVSSVGIQIFQHSQEVKTNSTHSSCISETLFNLDSSAFTVCQFQSSGSFGSEKTGVVGIRVRIAAVAAGSTHALNNGFVIEQASLGIGNPPGALQSWQRKRLTPDGELQDCMRFYEKTYDPSLPIGSLAAGGYASLTTCTSGAQMSLPFKIYKRAVPTMTSYSPNTGVSARGWQIGGGGNPDVVVTNTTAATYGFSTILTATTNFSIGWHWVADARI